MLPQAAPLLLLLPMLLVMLLLLIRRPPHPPPYRALVVFLCPNGRICWADVRMQCTFSTPQIDQPRSNVGDSIARSAPCLIRCECRGCSSRPPVRGRRARLLGLPLGRSSPFTTSVEGLAGARSRGGRTKAATPPPLLGPATSRVARPARPPAWTRERFICCAGAGPVGRAAFRPIPIDCGWDWGREHNTTAATAMCVRVPFVRYNGSSANPTRSWTDDACWFGRQGGASV